MYILENYGLKGSLKMNLSGQKKKEPNFHFFLFFSYCLSFPDVVDGGRFHLCIVLLLLFPLGAIFHCVCGGGGGGGGLPRRRRLLLRLARVKADRKVISLWGHT